MTPILAAKLAAAAALLALAFYLGGLRAKTALEADREAQALTYAHALADEQKAATAKQAALQRVVDAYDRTKDIPPISAGVVERLRLIQSASCRAMPSATVLARGTEAPGALPGGDAELDRLHQLAFDAAAADSAQLSAVIQLAP